MTGPERFRVALPTADRLQRVGKVRIGETYEGRKRDGTTGLFPRAIDHFRVETEETETTSPAAVDAFRSVYGAEPRQLRVRLVGASPDDNLEGAYRLYGTGKLKRRCDGESCSERTTTGAFVTKPCVCAADGIPDDSKQHCSLTYTLQFLLPGVAGLGVWQIDTGSEISVRNLASFLHMIHELRGTLSGYEFDLRVVPRKVAPDGQTKTVYVLEGNDFSLAPDQITPASALPPIGQARGELQPEPVRSALPAPALDEDKASEHPLAAQEAPAETPPKRQRRSRRADPPSPPAEAPAGNGAASATAPGEGGESSAAPPTGRSQEEAEAPTSLVVPPAKEPDLRKAVNLQLAVVGSVWRVTPTVEATVREICRALVVRSSSHSIAESFGEKARDLTAMAAYWETVKHDTEAFGAWLKGDAEAFQAWLDGHEDDAGNPVQTELGTAS